MPISGDSVQVSSGNLSVASSGKLSMAFTDSSATPGNATIGTPSGRCAIAAAASAVVVTNPLVTAASQILVVNEGPTANNTGALICVPGAGSFTVTSVSAIGAAQAATAANKFSWMILNP